MRIVVLTHWFAYIPLTAAILATIYLPGFLVGLAGGAARHIALVAAPALTFAIVGLTGVVGGLLDITWGWPILTVATGVFVLAGIGVGRLHAMERFNRVWHSGADIETNDQIRARRAMLVLAAAFLILPVLGFADPNVPSSQADPMFHYNGVNGIVHTGNASALEAMGINFGIRVWPATYPTVWHSILALFGNSRIMPATHVFAYIVLPIVWLVGLDFFVRVSLPRNPRAWVIAPVISVLLPYFPNFLSVSRGFWPNSIAIAIIPVIYGLGVLTVRTIPFTRIRDAAVPVALIGAAGIGMGLAHPGAVFAVLWPIVPLAGWAVVVGGIRGVRQRSAAWLMLAGVSAISLIAGSTLLWHPRLHLFLNRTHPRSWDTAERLATLWQELAGVPTAFIALAVVAGIAVLIGISIAITSAWKVTEARWIIIAWFAQWLIVFGSYVDGTIFSAIAGIWYHDPKRAMAIQTIFTTAIVALVIERWSRNQARHAMTIVASTVVVSLGIGVVFRLGTVYQDARPPIGPERILDSRDEIALLERLDDLIPAGSVIVGDATTGLGYAPAYSRVNVVFPQVNYRSSDVNGLYVRDNFRDIHTDPYICDILSGFGIGYYYEDQPLVYQKRDRSETWPGLYGVDTSRGFTKIAESDGGTLWQIDACGEIRTPDWWDVDARFHTLPPSAESAARH